MLAVTKSSRPEIMNGAFSCCCGFSAIGTRPARRLTSTTAMNSSPLRRASVSLFRSERRSRSPVPTQHVVAGLMSERIVDLLEMIDVDEEQSRDVSLAMCA